MPFGQATKLELGGGGQPIRTRDPNRRDFLNMDAFPMPTVDIVHDATVFPWPFDSNSLDEIYSSEFMEHISYHQTLPLLKEAHRVLKSGGKFVFECPDFMGIAKHYVNDAMTREEFNYMKRGVLGDGSRSFDYHLNILMQFEIYLQLSDVGFIDVNRYPAPTWREDYVELKKQFSEEFIQSVKLCMTATKP